MRVELIPHRVEVTVGESVVLSCKATHDTSLDVTFQWFFNQRPITFQQDRGHFEYIQTVRSKVRLRLDFLFMCDLFEKVDQLGQELDQLQDFVLLLPHIPGKLSEMYVKFIFCCQAIKLAI